MVKRLDVIPHFKSGHKFAQFIIILLWGSIIISAIALGFDVFQIILLYKIKAGEAIKEATAIANDSRILVFEVLRGLIFLITIIPFLMWLYRVHRNLPALGATNLKFSPGWVVGYFFIPILNISRPYEAVKEIWKGSDPDWSFSSLEKAPVSHLIGFWWAIFLFSGVMNYTVGKDYIDILIKAIKATETISSLLVTSWFMGGLLVIEIIDAVLAINIVRKIDRRQEKKNLQKGGIRGHPLKGTCQEKKTIP